MNIIDKAIEEIKPYEKNAKLHPEKQIQQIAKSIQELGFNVPILVDANNTIIAGHGRYFAAKKLQLETVPCILIDHLTEKQKRAFIIADNKLNLNTGFDIEMLKSEFEAMQDEINDLTLTGFTQEELDELFPEKATDKNYLTDPDEIPETPETPVCRLGDIWQLNNHRLMCGDSTNEESVKVLMNGEKAHMVFTDPPYNVNYESKLTGKIQNDNMSDNDFLKFITKVYSNLYLFSSENSAIYICHATMVIEFDTALRLFDWRISNKIIWVKDIPTYSMAQYKWKYEPIHYVVKGSPPFLGDRTQVNVWEIKSIQSAGSCDDKNNSWFKGGSKNLTLHPTQKPVDLPIKAILNSLETNKIVLDLFTGSGSTLIAAEKTNRTCYGMELEPKYCDVIIKRWEDFTGQKAVHVDTNKTFIELKAIREIENKL